MDIQTMTAYTVYASTGCSCCNSEHYRGPWRTREEAEAAAARYREDGLVSSQYAPQGRYFVEEHEAEVLPDGRLILGGSRVLSGFIGENNTDEYIGQDLY